MIKQMFDSASLFNAAILNLEAPAAPIKLTKERKDWTVCALREEIDELDQATTLEDQADALIDLLYFVLGRFHEMGIAYGQAFEEVHDANMTKTKGMLAKRQHSDGNDAVKPEGFQPPTHAELAELRTEHLAKARLYDALPTVFREIHELALAKAADYNQNGVTRSDYFPFDDLSYVQMLWVKVLRLRSLAEASGARFESKRDTLVDLINYARFYIDHLDGAQ